MGGSHTFRARITKGDAANAWQFVVVPFSVEEAFGSRGRVYVQGSVDGTPFRGSLAPNGDGTHVLVLTREVREVAGVGEGDTVDVVVEAGASPAAVEVPADLTASLAKRKTTLAAWEKLAPSHRRAYVKWVEEAKRPETRAKRIAKAAEMVAAGQPLK